MIDAAKLHSKQLGIVELFLALPRRLVASLEDPNIPFIYYPATFFCILILRSFVESFTQNSVNYLDFNSNLLLQDLAHFYCAFTSGAISLTLLFYAATRERIDKILKVIFTSFAIILVGPILDFIVSKGMGFDMTYVHATYSASLVGLFTSFFGNYHGMTLGMRAEVFITLYFSFSYFIIKGRNLFFSLCYTFLVYGIIFLYCIGSDIVRYFLTHLGYDYIYTSLLMARFYLLILFITLIPLAYLAHNKIFIEIIKDLRWLRLTHYVLMLLFGFALGVAQRNEPLKEILTIYNPPLLVNIIFCIASIIFSGLFSIITNNFTDQPIDCISNPQRPLITASIPLQNYLYIALSSLFLALVYAAFVNGKALFIILVMLANYFIYSMFPIRFKRVLLFSKLAISLNSLAAVLLGYILVMGNIRGVPNAIYPIFLLGFTLAANFIDIKDLRGDRQEKIKTLPTFLSLPRAKMFISLAFLCTYLSFYFIIPRVQFLWFFFMGGLVQIYLINKKKYDESLVFLFHLLSIVGLIVYFLRLF